MKKRMDIYIGNAPREQGEEEWEKHCNGAALGVILFAVLYFAPICFNIFTR